MDALHRFPGVTVARVGVGCVWLAGAVFNLIWTLPNADSAWDDLGKDATFGVYRWFFADVVGGAPVFWTLALVAGELGLGILLLGKGVRARYGLAGSTLWSVFLSFLILPYTLMMPLWALLTLWLLRFDHPVGIMDVLHRDRLSGKGA